MSSSMSFSLCCDCDAQTGSLSYPLSNSVGVLINERSCACVHILKQIFSAVHIIAHTIKFVFNFTQCEITLNVSIGGSCLVSVSGLSTRVIEKKHIYNSPLNFHLTAATQAHSTRTYDDSCFVVSVRYSHRRHRCRSASIYSGTLR